MQFTCFALTLAAVAGIASAQISECAYGCLGQFQKDVSSTGCGAYTDQNMPCICAHESSFDNTKSCVHKACPPDQAEKAVAFMLQKCRK